MSGTRPSHASSRTQDQAPKARAHSARPRKRKPPNGVGTGSKRPSQNHRGRSARPRKRKPPNGVGTGSKKQGAKAYARDEQLLTAAAELFLARRALREATQRNDQPSETLRRLRHQAQALCRVWHTSFSLAGKKVALARRAAQHRLSRLDREVLAGLILGQLGMLPSRPTTIAEILAAIALPGSQTLAGLRAVSEHGRLHRANLITFDDADEELARRTAIVEPALVESLLAGRPVETPPWQVSSEPELFGRMQALTRALMKKSEALHNVRRGYGGSGEFFRWTQKVYHLLSQVYRTLDLHPSWKLNTLQQESLPIGEQLIFLALLGKELGHLDPDESLFSGGGLARAAADSADDVSTMLAALSPARHLIGRGWIQPCDGPQELASDDPGSLERMEFELAPKALDQLAIKRCRMAGRGDFVARQPTVHMEQLVLPPQVQRALQAAVAQVRHAAQILDQWGLGELIPYGRSPVLLFSGPPGTGKTATAEAFARELGRPILVADYARIQNCFVGQTEKNIVRAFREARAAEAVLFWDEADAMFFDRDTSRYSWEVRDVNVLLQSLEHFEGVCILATNRKLALDPALHRRIALKVEFPRPDQDQRRQIWQRLLPPRMPLAADVDLDRLSQEDLVGGEIKNIVLNAARLALLHGAAAVAWPHFQEALTMEREGGGTGAGRNPIGFGG